MSKDRTYKSTKTRKYCRKQAPFAKPWCFSLLRLLLVLARREPFTLKSLFSDEGLWNRGREREASPSLDGWRSEIRWIHYRMSEVQTKKRRGSYIITKLPLRVSNICVIFQLVDGFRTRSRGASPEFRNPFGLRFSVHVNEDRTAQCPVTFSKPIGLLWTKKSKIPLDRHGIAMELNWDRTFLYVSFH